MDRIHRADLKQLVDHRKGPCVSLFMPMHVADRDATEDPIRLRELADEAEKKLTDGGMRRDEAGKLMAPLRALLQDIPGWNHRGRSLAFFAAPGFSRSFHVTGELPASVEVNDHFCVLPLLPLITDEERFFVLALSQNSVRLFEGDADTLREVPLPGAPRDLKEAIGIEDAEHGKRYHSGMAGAVGKQQAIFHGQGGKPETIKEDLRQFLRRLAPAVDKQLNGEHAPLVLATVEATVPLWREVSHYKFLLDDFLAGSPDHLTPAELHAKAWPLVQPALAGHRKWCERRLLEAEGAKVANSLRDIVPAAMMGRVSALFIDSRRHRWGQYDAANNTCVLHRDREPNDQDLVELAVIETVRQGGDVFDMRPEESGAAEAANALLRF
jgi:hypothetical protein